MSKYHHLFFDLDHTIWDFEANSRRTLSIIFEAFSLEQKGAHELSQFIQVYEEVNYEMWGLYRMGKMAKETLRTERFRRALAGIGIKDKQLHQDIATYYVEHSPKQSLLFPGAIDTLEALSQKYSMSIITNGFEEVQGVKMESSKLTRYFDHVITSEQAGVTKPHAQIFEKAAEIAQVDLAHSLMIGDNQEADIQGAINVGMDAVLFNPNGEVVNVQPTFHIQHLAELKSFL